MYKKLIRIFIEDKKELYNLYFFAILSGIMQLILPLGIQSIISYIIGGFISTSIIILIIIVLLSVVADGKLHVEQMKLIERVQQKLYVRYSEIYSQKMKSLDIGLVKNYKLSQTYNTFLEISSLQKGSTKLLLEIPVSLVSIIFGVILLSFYNSFFVLFGLLLIGFAAAIIYVTGGRGLSSSIRESDFKYSLTSWLQQTANMVYRLKFFNTSNVIKDKSDELTIGYLENRNEHFKVLVQQYNALIIFKILLTASMLIVGTFLLVNNQINIGQFIASEIIILLIINAVEKLIINLDTVYDILTSIQKLEKISDLKDETYGTLLVNKNERLALKVNALNYSKKKKSFSIEVPPFSQISIPYTNLNEVHQIVNSICGFEEPNYYSIYWNQLPIKNYNLDNLRSHIGIFDGQIRWLDLPIHDNIDLNLSKREKIDQQILRITHLQQHLETLPKGLDEIIVRNAVDDYSSFSHSVQLASVLSNPTEFNILIEPFRFVNEKDNEALADFILTQKNKTWLVFTHFAYYINKTQQHPLV